MQIFAYISHSIQNVSLYLHMYLLYLCIGTHTYLRNCVLVCVAYEYMKRMTNGCRRMKMNKHSNTHFRAAAGNNPKPEQNFKELHALPLSLCRCLPPALSLPLSPTLPRQVKQPTGECNPTALPSMLLLLLPPEQRSLVPHERVQIVGRRRRQAHLNEWRRQQGQTRWQE